MTQMPPEWHRRRSAARQRLKERYRGEYDTLHFLQQLSGATRHQARSRTLRAVADNHKEEFRRIFESLVLEDELPKGVKSEPGETRTSANGYHYTRTETEWRLTHHIVAEEKILGRALADDEMVLFVGSKEDLSPENLRVVKKGTTSIRRRLAKVEADIEELTAERDRLRSSLRLDNS